MVPGKRSCTTDCSNGALIIEVEDDGPGIPADVLPRVFDPFFTTKDVGHGEGLGLYVSQEIIDLHGGCIGVSSEPGKGARYMICLPSLPALEARSARRVVPGRCRRERIAAVA